MASLRWGRVAAIHPEDYSVDLVMTDDGSHLAAVQVLTPFASTSSGFACLIQPSTSANGDVWDLTQPKATDVLAGVAFFGQFPVVIGFRYPQVCQMLFADLQRAINRHPSDFYTSIDSQGNFEAYHPSGTYLRIGTSSAHEDLTGKDFDGNWKITKNTTTAPHVHLTVANAGSSVASVDIDPSGNVTLQNNGNLSATVGGNVTATVTGNVDITSPQTTIHGPLHVTGVITADQTITATGEIKSGTIGLQAHHHTAQGATSPTTAAQT